MSKNSEYKVGVYNENGYVMLFPNVGDGIQQAHPPNPYAESKTQQFPLGTKLIQGDRVWRYCKNAAVELAMAVPIQSADPLSAEMNYNIACAAADIAATEIFLTSTTNLAAVLTKDKLKEGYVFINDEAGEGQMRKIKEHDAFLTTTATSITLYDPLTVALTTSSQAGLIENPYANVIAVTALVNMCVGVPLFVVTASYYFWSQTGGPAPVETNAAIAIGTAVVVGTTAAQADPAASVTTEVLIGYPLAPCSTDTEKLPVFLTLDR